MNQRKKRLLCEFQDFKCEACKKVFKLEVLEIHRIRRGNQGGTYEYRNCKVVCKKCHKLLHGNEFSNVQGK